MPLIDLLKNPQAYRTGRSGQNAHSKKIKYASAGAYSPKAPLLGERVKWDIKNDNADPEFQYGSKQKRRWDTIDSFIRGGLRTAADRRLIDVKRITKFLLTSNGIQWLTTQTLLQSQNPRPQKLYNPLGLNTLASIATAGGANVRRGGPLPTFGDLDLASEIGLVSDHQLLLSDYLTEVGGENDISGSLRQNKYSLGDPGKPSEKDGIQKVIDVKNPFEEQGARLTYNVMKSGSIDKLNELDITAVSDTEIQTESEKIKDFVDFRFEVVNYDNIANDLIRFRAFIDNISDNYRANHSEFKYNGRGEPFYIYNSFNRAINLSFKIAAQTRWEMKPLYKKLNYLVAQTAPNYSPLFGRIRTPFMYITVGDWFNKIPGLITSVDLSWQKDYIWEIAADRVWDETKKELGGKDKDMLVLPHVLDVSLNFRPIHSFLPRNSQDTPFIGIDGRQSSPDWSQQDEIDA